MKFPSFSKSILTLALALATCLKVSGDPPAWWSDGDPPAWDVNAEPNNKGPANIGQAKWMASEALRALQAVDPALSAAIRDDLTLPQPDSNGGTFPPILDFSVPDPKPPDWIEKQKSPLLIGQLKAIATPFYTRLNALDSTWLANQRTANGTNQPDSIFPWSTGTDDDMNSSIAMVGQLKAVFSLEFEVLQSTLADPDGDGLPTSLELILGLDPNNADSDGDGTSDGAGDYDDDGLTNLQEVGARIDPAKADTDGDSISDGEEVASGHDPRSNQSFPPRWISTTRYGVTLSTPPFMVPRWMPELAYFFHDEFVEGWELPELLGTYEFPEDAPEANLPEGYSVGPPEVDGWLGDWAGELNQARCWLQNRPAKGEAIRRTVLRVTQRTINSFSGPPTTLPPGIEVLQVTIPPNATHSDPIDLLPTFSEVDENQYEHVKVSLLPVSVVELSPKTKDEDGNEIDGSEKPNQGEPLTPFVEEDPHANRIAHRELKVRIGEALKGKEVTWTLEPLFVPHFDPNGPNLPPVFRGEWADSPVSAHQNAFEASSVYGANEFEIESGEGEDAVAKTTVADDGFTAIRVNVPPIGFNQARISIQIEGTSELMNLLDMEVPAVIVIDPGHGTGPTLPDSNAIGGEGDDTGELEHAFALDLAQRTRTEIRAHEEAQRRNIRVFLTRENTTNISAVARTEVARENGCDVYMSIHFNDSTSRLHRDPFGMWDLTGNLNLEEDQALAIRLRQAVQAAITEIEPAESRDADRSDYDSEHWESVLQKGLDTCSDLQGGSPYNGNVPGYTPCRAALIEIEWMSHSAADAFYNTNPLREQIRAATAEHLADACIRDVIVQPETN